ncbi:MAG TPA: cell division protein FtsA [Thermoanaerobacterales bacterium]|uniref:cell division protein FtsA n=1 Tax=Tepidanaerobacter sp. GT38 TaxID=2722793 RepID=UPI00181FFF38|nr:cell division protein FtsA [Tepidanaerobacter sp. GT38]MCG1012173.1 cell division protein FtsA [Tepidanaerobacter sp. GT38]HHY42367.1 cell division protein FtsA [Thermoanaerobacterales bacterium]
MGKGNIIASLDLGTSKTCCMVGEITRSGFIDILGYGISQATGIKKGAIINLDLVIQSITKAVELAEQMSNTKITNIFVGLSGGNITLLNNRGVVAIPRNDREINPQDVDRVIQAAKIMAIPYDREIIDVIPREFIVDGYSGIKDPVGMLGTRLEVSACIVVGLLTAIQNIARCVQKAGLSVESMILKPLAAAEMLLTDDEMNMGVALVDVGAGTTEIAVFQEGCISAYDMIPIGGDLITNDIAIGLRVPYAQAEEIKCKYACAMPSLASDKPDIEIQSLGDAVPRKISQKDLAAIVEPRVQEILSYIVNSIAGFNLKTMLPAGIVFTGGGLVHIKGFLEMSKRFLEFPIRIGITDSYGEDQTFTVALGLLNYIIKHRAFNVNSVMKERSASGFLERAKRFLREYF